MLYIVGSLLFIAASVSLFRRAGVTHAWSKGAALAIAISLLAVAALSQNYTQSLLPSPEINDGISVANPIAYWIVGEDGWSKERFKAAFEASLRVALLLVLAYPAVVVWETKFSHRGRK